ncbi:hypothetical protein EV361DRAFT_50815 [Lentinula raphanica]|uniref:Bacteriophage T5 Orf172 DNA-binding domain-containing protein n=1 Tax=Lentinula raphanica TaxID=153919 RepID=A0AA38UC15_9AGAR|nr:hypothetical protein F5880DRAFT_1505063 [Lentinula raphanica]KAJ3836521.1 hypothetical protein F5878DRAFT_643486 [Lentinula raphanica]KAJ3964535.1 hypothetical protein EV361DRAFT_50815 [Lentinula raphanica]
MVSPPPLVMLNAKRPLWKLMILWRRFSNQEISNADRAGWIYVFHEAGSSGGIFKVGRTNNLERRIHEWKADCPGQLRTWLGAFWTPFAHRTEYLIHLALEAQCTCRPRFICDCGTTHLEKFTFIGDDPRTVFEELITPVIVEVVALVSLTRSRLDTDAAALFQQHGN